MVTGAAEPFERWVTYSWRFQPPKHRAQEPKRDLGSRWRSRLGACQHGVLSLGCRSFHVLRKARLEVVGTRFCRRSSCKQRKYPRQLERPLTHLEYTQCRQKLGESLYTKTVHSRAHDACPQWAAWKENRLAELPRVSSSLTAEMDIRPGR